MTLPLSVAFNSEDSGVWGNDWLSRVASPEAEDLYLDLFHKCNKGVCTPELVVRDGPEAKFPELAGQLG